MTAVDDDCVRRAASPDKKTTVLKMEFQMERRVFAHIFKAFSSLLHQQVLQCDGEY
jgi:hypothetical protein